jgi:hypothetical protein
LSGDQTPSISNALISSITWSTLPSQKPSSLFLPLVAISTLSELTVSLQQLLQLMAGSMKLSSQLHGAETTASESNWDKLLTSLLTTLLNIPSAHPALLTSVTTWPLLTHLAAQLGQLNVLSQESPSLMTLPSHSSALTTQLLRLFSYAHAQADKSNHLLVDCARPPRLLPYTSLTSLKSLALPTTSHALTEAAELTQPTAHPLGPVLLATFSAQISNVPPLKTSVLLNSALAHQLETLLESSNAGINPVLHPLILAQAESPALWLDKFSVKVPALTTLYNANNQLNASAPPDWDALMALALTRLATVLPPFLVDKMKLFA